MIPLIAAGAALFGQGINALSTSSQNAKDRQFAREQYATQRRDALADWERNNAYNHPTAQMERLRAAGLNPNLVYGNGADAQAQPVRASSASSVKGTAPQYDPAAIITAFMETQRMMLANDNLREQNTLIQNQAELAKANTFLAEMRSNTEGMKPELINQQRRNLAYRTEQLTEQRPYQLIALQKAIEKQKADIEYTIDQNRRSEGLYRNTLANGLMERAAKSQSINESQTRVLMMKATIANLQKDGIMKDLENAAAAKGYKVGTPAYEKLMNVAYGSLEDAVESVKGPVKSVELGEVMKNAIKNLPPIKKP